MFAGGTHRRRDLRGRRREGGFRTHGLGVLDEINRHIVPCQRPVLGVAETQFVAEVGHAAGALQAEDALVAVVIHDDDGQL